MVKLTFLAGGFSAFISTYIFDSDAQTLTLTKNSTTGEAASWIALNPKDSEILYATNEIGPIGNLQSFTIDAAAGPGLVVGKTVATGGNGPTYTEVLSTGEVTALNFGSPNMAIVPTDPKDPLTFVDSPDNIISFPVNGGPSNPHMSLEHKEEVFIPDLGADRIWRLKKEGNKYELKGQIEFAAGNGPRHIAIQDEILFTLHEKTSHLTAQTIPLNPNDPATPLIANVSIIPPPPGTEVFSTPANGKSFNGTYFAAEILISEPTDKFPDSLIYVSNRNLGPDLDPRGDTIAIFEFKKGGSGSSATAGTASQKDADQSGNSGSSQCKKPQGSDAAGAPATGPTTAANAAQPTSGVYRRQRRAIHSRFFSRRQTAESDPEGQGELVLVTQVHTGLSQIRSMALGEPTDGGDEFLVAAANTEGGVAIFQRTDGGRNLELVVRNVENQNRTSFVFL